MEKKEIQKWRDRLIKMFGIYHSDGQEYITCTDQGLPLCGINLDELAKHMIEELDKAREDGIRYALSEVQGRVGVQNEEVYVLCNAILQESLIFDNK
ncbi:MAG: hypothetical protein BWY21_01675 [Parcubacteria group bacterium ADurb.Bin216]|nr:MAG: hypothetical protein BWY21_01675 [Parcubacteria group bacterium ADurb.Bin216]